MRSNPHNAEAPEGLLWTRDGRLRLAVVLSVLILAHLLTTVLVVHLLARSEAAAQQDLLVGPITKAHE